MRPLPCTDQLARREAELAAARRRRGPMPDPASLTAGDLVDRLVFHGAQTIERLAIEAQMPVWVVQRYVRALEGAGLAKETTLRSLRGGVRRVVRATQSAHALRCEMAEHHSLALRCGRALHDVVSVASRSHARTIAPPGDLGRCLGDLRLQAEAFDVEALGFGHLRQVTRAFVEPPCDLKPLVGSDDPCSCRTGVQLSVLLFELS